MYPLLLQLGPISIHTYGFMIAVGFLASIHVAKRLSIRSHLNVDQVLDLAFYNLIVGLLGARLLFVITRFSYFANAPLDIFKIWEGGLVFLGGPLAVFPFMIFYAKKHRLNIWKVMDAMAPGLALGHAFGRFGCLAAGCCYGKPTGTSFGIRLNSELVDRSLHGVLLHPTQLYEAFSLFLLSAGLAYIFKIKKFDGQVAFSYLLTYPVIRSVIEVFRGDLIRGFIIDDVLSTSQFISLLVFLGAAALLVFRLGQVKNSSRSSKKIVQPSSQA
ncbi:MAG: prolipoprotein diacylglyceryl transferase [Bdellovibrionia bacterium]